MCLRFHGDDMTNEERLVTLKVDGLKAFYTSKKGLVKAVNDVSFTVHRGESVGLFGESGAGKTSVALAIIGLFERMAKSYSSAAAHDESKHLWSLKKEARKKGLTSTDMGSDLPGVEGHIWFKGRDLVTLDEKEYLRIRGEEISYIPQGTVKSLSPYETIEHQTGEVLWVHDEDDELFESEVLQRVLEVLGIVELTDVDIRRRMKPMQFSVGEDQRILIAMAMISNPALIIADEPTTAVDAGIQLRILEALEIIRDRSNIALLLISNNQGVIAQTTDKVAVMSAGRIMEFGDTVKVLKTPKHPFTRAFIMSNPPMEFIKRIREKGLRIRGLPGLAPDMSNLPSGCPFHPRCEYAEDICKSKVPEYREIEPGYFIFCHRYEEIPNF
jgi:peptide/nickel transport system ATP-binding protein